MSLANKFASGSHAFLDVSPQTAAGSPFGRVSRDKVRTASQGVRQNRCLSTKFPGKYGPGAAARGIAKQNSVISQQSSTGTPIN